MSRFFACALAKLTGPSRNKTSQIERAADFVMINSLVAIGSPGAETKAAVSRAAPPSCGNFNYIVGYMAHGARVATGSAGGVRASCHPCDHAPEGQRLRR